MREKGGLGVGGVQRAQRRTEKSDEQLWGDRLCEKTVLQRRIRGNGDRAHG